MCITFSVSLRGGGIEWMSLHIAVLWLLSAASVAFENENDAFWIREAEAQSLLLVMAFCQRPGDVFMARAGKGPPRACSYRVEEGTADAPKLAFAA
jgi:hypothetical protein